MSCVKNSVENWFRECYARAHNTPDLTKEPAQPMTATELMYKTRDLENKLRGLRHSSDFRPGAVIVDDPCRVKNLKERTKMKKLKHVYEAGDIVVINDDYINDPIREIECQNGHRDGEPMYQFTDGDQSPEWQIMRKANVNDIVRLQEKLEVKERDLEQSYENLKRWEDERDDLKKRITKAKKGI